MDALELPEADAFARLQRAARNRNVRLPTIAQDVIDQHDLLRRPHDQAHDAP
jgi:AmiR/NasT family two-component response regulator